ncbi:MAG: dipeptide epimerase [Halobacteriaceae archaeon]
MSLTTSFETLELPLDRPFTISRGTTDTTENVVVEITDDGGTTGVGAAAPSRHYGETAATVTAVLPDLLEAVERIGDPHAITEIKAACRSVVDRNPAARAAVSIAVHDLAAKRVGLPLYRFWGLDPTDSVETSFSLGIDDPDTVREKAADAVAAGHDVLKLKLGTDHDRALVEAVREAAPDARLRVDANEAWTPHETVENAAFLADHDVEFIEQPVPADDPDGLAYAHDHAALPIAADESLETAADVRDIADRVDIANLKLMKCGSLTEARRIIAAADAAGLEIMCGCMVETNAAIAAASHLAPLLDYADLDGSLLLAEDPYAGVPLDDGYIDLTALDRPGTGAHRP